MTTQTDIAWDDIETTAAALRQAHQLEAAS